ncbi:SulP family inorganic anion transporter [Nitrincola alkalisediminis]|uniref:SulP family inorganic anion transporter n=1 Tax=Nitrincola alkalisediminis TaxID=1366656 RepID=UPI00187463A3|nr:SulP family inorganic anion transporter [Nitrincola alkalisediminis]
MRGYSISLLKGDIFGGLTAGVVALPLALAFGVASGAGAAAGLYGAIVLGLVAACLGGTRVQISGPTGPMTVVFASALAAFGGSFEMALAVVLVGGILQIGLGLLKTGGLVRYIPYPVISGFMSGIGFIIILLQTAPLLGAPASASPLEAILKLPANLGLINVSALAMGLLTLAIVFLTPIKISRFIPSPLLALVLCTIISVALDLHLPIIGDIPTGLPEFHLPTFTLSQWSLIFSLGLTLALLGSIDSLLTSIVADSVTQTRHQPNRELIGQGIGNILCSFVGGLPGAGATMRTVVNINSGGKTRVSGVIHSLFLLTLLLGLAPLAAQIPLAVLAGILIKVGIDILDYRLLKLLKQAPKPESLIMASVFALTVLVDLVMAVGVGVVLAMGLLTWRVAKEADITFDTSNTRYPYLDKANPGTRIVQVKGPLFFGSTSHMLDRIETVDKVVGTQQIIFDCRKVDFLDLTAIFTLDDMVARLHQRKIRPKVVATQEIRQQLLQMNTPNLTESIIFADMKEAMGQ